MVGDVLGRVLRRAGRLEIASKPFVYQGRAGVERMFFDEFESRAGNLNLTLGSTGIRFNPVGNFLLSASVLFPLNRSGLRSHLSTAISLDYTF